MLSGEGLKAKAFRGGAWLGTGSVAEQAFRFGRSMVLTRLLAPEAFGIMAVVMSASSVIHTITDIGVKEALIQNPRGTEDHYMRAAWWLALGRAVSIAAFVCLVAPLLAKFYGNAEMTPLLRVATLAVVLDGAFSSKAYIAMKEMKFSRWAWINHGGGIIGILITITLSFFLRDVWALVIGVCAESAARCSLSFILCPFLPSFSWNKEAMQDLLRFSKGLFGLSFLNLVFARTDIFVLAKLYPAAQLGLYSMAIYLAQTPVNYLMNLLGQTMLPTFSQIQNDNSRVNRIIVQVSSLLLFLGVPVLVFVFFCGRSLLAIVFGQSYSAATAALIATCAVSLVNLLNSQITVVFYAKGRPQLHRRCVFIMALIMIVITYPFAKWFGLVGGQLACLLAVVVGYLFQVARVRGLTDLDLSRYWKSFPIAVGVSISVAAVCLGARLSPALGRPVPTIIVGVLGCLLAYGFSAAVLLHNNRRIAE
jgi:O-antigen/teichoic acid export membrane protein